VDAPAILPKLTYRGGDLADSAVALAAKLYAKTPEYRLKSLIFTHPTMI